jgi:Tfp pilus assembly major pilin PilA
MLDNLKSYEKVLTEIHVIEAQEKISRDMEEAEKKKAEKERKRNIPKKTTKTKSTKKNYKSRKK